MSTDLTKTDKPAGDRFEDLWETKEIAREQRAIEANTKLSMELEDKRHEHALAEHRAANELAAQRDAANLDRHEASNNTRDRRVVWIESASNYQGEDFAARADHVLDEYDKRWPA